MRPGTTQPAPVEVAWFAALLFCVGASSAETVAWVDARFDLIAAAFALAALDFCFRYLSTGRAVHVATAAALGVCGALTKESAFCLPVLISCLAIWNRPVADRRLWRAATIVAFALAAVFAYRMWALDGIGGYRDATGEPGILSASILRSAHSISVRLWAILLFPVNWTTPLAGPLRAAIAIAPSLLLVAAWRNRASRRRILGCVAFTGAAALPIQHMLMLDSDLSGSRIVYLPSAGWALLFGVLLDSEGGTGWRNAAAALWIALQSCLLAHNLAPWRAVPLEAAAICADFGRRANADPSQATWAGQLPVKKSGVVFLANGFPECVEMNSGFPADRVLRR